MKYKNTRDKSHKKPESPSSIEETKGTSKERRIQSITTDDIELKADGDENDGSQKSSSDRRELKIIAKYIRLTIVVVVVACTCCSHV
jgi:hypothetical protein